MREYQAATDAARRRKLGSLPYWYLFLIGGESSQIEPPFLSCLISPFVQKAREDGVSLWLEAMNEQTRKACEALGLQVVEELKIGGGRCDKLGNLVEGGEGVSVWAMISDLA